MKSQFFTHFILVLSTLQVVGQNSRMTNDERAALSGYHDVFSNTYTSRGTAEEIAAATQYMIKDGKKISNPGKDSIDILYGDGKAVITTITDSLTGRTVFEVLPPDTYVPENEQYSTKWGPKETFGNAFKDFCFNAYSAASVGYMKFICKIEIAINEYQNYDQFYLYKQGNNAIYFYFSKLRKATLAEGNIEATIKIDNAYESKDYDKMNDVFNYTETNVIDPILGRKLKYIRQPSNYIIKDKALQAKFNKLKQADFNQSITTTEGSSFACWVARFGRIVGYLIFPIAILIIIVVVIKKRKKSKFSKS